MRHQHHLGKWLAIGAFALIAPFLSYAQEAEAPPHLAKEIDSAIQVFDSLIRVELPPPQRAFVENALKEAHGFAVFPSVQRVGVGVSAIQGSGVLSYRDRDGEWSVPIPLRVQGVSTGPHFGAINYASLVVIKTPAALERILSGQQRLTGMEATGPIQKAASPEQDIVAYSRTQGISVGLTVDDIHVSLNQQAIAALYGKTVEPREIMTGQKINLRRPPCAQKFLEGTNQLAGKAPNTIYWK